jgi:prepilin-type N-terminal cleavage/methylation domain-containing protein
MRRREHGLTLVELLVTMALMGTTLLAVTELFELSYGAIASAGRGALAPSAWHSCFRLRADGQASSPFALATAQRGPLRFDFDDGRSVVWKVEGGVLRRSEIDAEGRPSGGVPVLHGVVGWRWRSLSLDVLEVRITVEHPPPATGISTRRRQAEWIRTTEVLHIARRGRDGGRSW